MSEEENWCLFLNMDWLNPPLTAARFVSETKVMFRYEGHAVSIRIRKKDCLVATGLTQETAKRAETSAKLSLDKMKAEIKDATDRHDSRQRAIVLETKRPVTDQPDG